VGGFIGAVDIILPHAIRMGVLYNWMCDHFRFCWFLFLLL
jgi:hypothetical protein